MFNDAPACVLHRTTRPPDARHGVTIAFSVPHCLHRGTDWHEDC